MPCIFRDEMKDDYLTRRFCDEELAANIVSHSKCLSTLRILARQPFVCWMIATLFERYYRVQGYGVHPPRLTPLYVNILIVQTNRRLQFYYGRAENDLVMCISHCLFLSFIVSKNNRVVLNTVILLQLYNLTVASFANCYTLQEMKIISI